MEERAITAERAKVLRTETRKKHKANKLEGMPAHISHFICLAFHNGTRMVVQNDEKFKATQFGAHKQTVNRRSVVVTANRHAVVNALQADKAIGRCVT